MKIEIDEKIIAETTLCERNFECLNNYTNRSCKVENYIIEKVFYIKCLSNNTCNYKRLCGNSFMCACPTRIEIYKKYGIL
jgi:hypothetical protein